MKSKTEQLRFFETPESFREWLVSHHHDQHVLWVGYYKKHTKRQSLTWPESVEVALCFGWIDGLRHKIDENTYKIRFTPRRASSHWSNKNINTARELIKSGQMEQAGLDAFRKRDKKNQAKASYEQGKIKLIESYLLQIKENEKAWSFYTNLSPSVKNSTNWWIMSAKRKNTQLKRLQILIESSARNQKIPPLIISKK